MTLLPPNATDLELALDRVMDGRIAGLPVPLRALWSPQDCPPALLPWLAWGLSVDQWDPAWPIATRRAQIATAIGIQRQKGTVAAVRRVVESFGGAMVVREWWQTTPPGVPHTFTLTLSLPSDDSGAPGARFVNQVIAAVNAAKPLRSHYDLVLSVNYRAAIGLTGAARPATYARLPLAVPRSTIPANALTFRGMPLTLGGSVLTIGA